VELALSVGILTIIKKSWMTDNLIASSSEAPLSLNGGGVWMSCATSVNASYYSVPCHIVVDDTQFINNRVASRSWMIDTSDERLGISRGGALAFISSLPYRSIELHRVVFYSNEVLTGDAAVLPSWIANNRWNRCTNLQGGAISIYHDPIADTNPDIPLTISHGAKVHLATCVFSDNAARSRAKDLTGVHPHIEASGSSIYIRSSNVSITSSQILNSHVGMEVKGPIHTNGHVYIETLRDESIISPNYRPPVCHVTVTSCLFQASTLLLDAASHAITASGIDLGIKTSMTSKRNITINHTKVIATEIQKVITSSTRAYIEGIIALTQDSSGAGDVFESHINVYDSSISDVEAETLSIPMFGGCIMTGLFVDAPSVVRQLITTSSLINFTISNIQIPSTFLVCHCPYVRLCLDCWLAFCRHVHNQYRYCVPQGQPMNHLMV
jgi:hypothetical protein